jgi:undecaprenyl-diphosphatase
MDSAQPTKMKFAVKLKGLRKRVGLALLAGLVCAAGALILLATLADEMAEGEVKQFDDWVRDGIHRFSTPAVTFAMRGVTILGAPLFLFSLSLVVGAGFFVKKNYRAMILLTAAIAGSSLLNEVLKASFHRTRPLPFFDITAPNSYSFPSGHALMSFCFCSSMAALISRRSKSRTVRITVWALAGVLILAIGVSRIYLGVHYPSDVVAGYAAAFIWIMFIVIVDRAIPRKDDEAKD